MIDKKHLTEKLQALIEDNMYDLAPPADHEVEVNRVSNLTLSVRVKDHKLNRPAQIFEIRISEPW